MKHLDMIQALIIRKNTELLSVYMLGVGSEFGMMIYEFVS